MKKMTINKYFTKEYKKLSFAKDCKYNLFKEGQLVEFKAGFTGKGSRNVLNYQDKRMRKLNDGLWDGKIIFKVLKVEKDFVTVREINPFTGKFYDKAPTLKCHTWFYPEICGSDIITARGGDILPVGPWTIREVTQKIYLGETYMNVEFGGCCSFEGYVDDIERGEVDCTEWTADGKMIYTYACAAADDVIPNKLWKIKKHVKKIVSYEIEK